MADKKRDKKEVGKTFLERVLAKVPEEQRAAYAGLLTVDGVLDEVGEGVLMKDDYTRGVQEVDTNRGKVKAWKEQLDTWWNQKLTENAAKDAELAQLRAGGARTAVDDDDDDDDAGDSPAGKRRPAAALAALPADVARKGDVEAVRAGMRSEGIALASVLIPLALRHKDEFGEVLDVDALTRHCQAQQVGIDRGGYESFVKEMRDENAKKTRAKELEEAERRGEEKGLKKAREVAPGSVLGGPPSFQGTLSGLTRKKPDGSDKAASVVDRAVADYEARIAKRTSP